MDPFIEPIAGRDDGTWTTARLVEHLGPITARGIADGYQFIAFGNGIVYESSERVRSGSPTIWLAWSRRPCHDVRRLARSVNAVVEFA